MDQTNSNQQSFVARIVMVLDRVLERGVPRLAPQAAGMFRATYCVLMMLAIRMQLEPPDSNPPIDAHRELSFYLEFEFVHTLIANATFMWGCWYAAQVAFLLAAIGALSRFALAAAFGSTLLLVANRLALGGDHTWGLPLFILMGLLLVSWGRGLSVDNVVRRAIGRADEPVEPTWEQGFAVWLPGLMLGVAFAAAAVTKLHKSGLDWITSGSVRYHLMEDAHNAIFPIGYWLAGHPILAALLAFSVIAIEGGLILHVLFRNAWLRLLFGLAGFSMMAGFYLFMGVLWHAWWILFLCFLPWQPLWERLHAALPRAVVLLDGGCPMCRRTGRLLRAFDQLDQVQLADARFAAERATHAPGVSEETALREMIAVNPRRGRQAVGYDAYVLLARTMVLFWPLWPVLALPPVAAVGRRIYRRIADQRRRERCTDEACSIDRVERRSSAAESRSGMRPLIAVQAAFIVFVFAQQGVMLLLNREYEPFFSNYPMYSYTHESPEAYYETLRWVRYQQYYYVARFDDGTLRDVTRDMERLDRRIPTFSRSLMLVCRDVDDEASDRRERFGTIIREGIDLLESEHNGASITEVTVLFDQKAIDWEGGGVYWRQRGVPVGTVALPSLEPVFTDEADTMACVLALDPQTMPIPRNMRDDVDLSWLGQGARPAGRLFRAPVTIMTSDGSRALPESTATELRAALAAPATRQHDRNALAEREPDLRIEIGEERYALYGDLVVDELDQYPRRMWTIGPLADALKQQVEGAMNAAADSGRS